MTIRDRRLNADRRRLERLAANSDLIQIRARGGEPPEEYSVVFHCEGVVRLEAGEPVLGKEHQIELFLPAGYPLLPPLLRCVTAVFHPNIDIETGAICINTWYPGRLLDEVIVTIGRMIRYQNYNSASPLHVVAAQWATQNQFRFPLDERSFRRGSEDRETPDGLRIRIVRSHE